jgi:5-methylcytosine-specific restriction endonuclease McrA
MPTKAPRVCSCGKIVPANVVCLCIQRRKAEADKRRPSASQRGYDSEWQKAASAYLAEPANHYCECGAPATLVRHIVSIRQRPDLRMVRSNWKPGCRRCNTLDISKEARRG